MTTELELPQFLQGTYGLLGFIALCMVIFAVLAKMNDNATAWFPNMRKKLRADGLPLWVFLILAALWALLFLILASGLVFIIIDVVSLALPEQGQGADIRDKIWDWRFRLMQLAALTAVLGAVVALPFTIQRLRLTDEQTQTAKEALFNDKITAAAADLHAQRQVSKKVGNRKWETVWEDDIVRRNAAIDHLEGLVREQPAEATRVSRLLSVYVRELSVEIPAVKAPDTDDPEKLRDWVQNLKIPRSDMQNAVQVLGRLAEIKGVDPEALEIDLRHANLQAMTLIDAKFDKALLTHAHLEGADLMSAQLQGADLRRANMQGADLWGAKMQGADLESAKMQGADLESAEMQRANLRDAKMQRANLLRAEMRGANLEGAEFDSATNLSAAFLTAASVRAVNLSNVSQIQDHLEDVFGDGSVSLPQNTPWPAHWPNEELGYIGYDTQWRAFAATKGVELPEDMIPF